MNVKINITQLKYMLDNIPADQNIMLAGRHGIGKSEILTEYFSKAGMPVIALFLGQMSDPGDLIGLPNKDEKTGKTEFMPPYWFPIDNKPIVLFLDELNRARPEVLQTIMDLALNRKLAGKNLPKGSRIIAAVNEGEEYQLTDLDPALVSRFNIFRFEPSVEEWILWAQKKDVDSRVISFIRDNGTWLDKDPSQEEGEDTGLDKTPDRRAWKRVSDVIKGKENIEQNDVLLISSIIGVKATNIFIRKIRQNKSIEAKNLLNDFDSKVPLLANLSLHQFTILNEDIFSFIESRYDSFTNRKKIADNLKKYIEYLKAYSKNEVLASFSHYLNDKKYEEAAHFIAAEAFTVYREIVKYTSDIKA